VRYPLRARSAVFDVNESLTDLSLSAVENACGEENQSRAVTPRSEIVLYSQGEQMKYVMTWTPRFHGSAQENEAATRRGLELFSKWQQPAGSTFHQFVARLDGAGGFAVVETDNPADLLDGTSKFATLNDFQLYPVVDMPDWVRAAQEGVEFRESIS
jgi:hypothetical protein